MKVLITGGTGFIGARLAEKLTERGDTVSVIGLVNTPAEAVNRERLHHVGANVALAPLADLDLLRRLTRECDVVFHLAAAQHEANVPDEHFWTVNVDGTRNLLEACGDAGVGRFVHGSTIGVYGAAADGALNEDSPLRPDNIYGITKLEGERLVRSFARRRPATIVRISETYGPGDRRLLKLFRAIERRFFFVIGRGENKHQLIYIDDVVDGLIMAATSPQALDGVFILAGEEVLSTGDMVRLVAQALDAPTPRLRIPMWPFLLAAIVFERVLQPIGVQPPIHRRRLDFFRKSFFFSPGKASEGLKFKARTGFAAGARMTAQWYRANGWL